MSRKHLLLAGLFFSACGTGQFEENSLPDAVGSPGELVIVSDDTIWMGKAGEQIRKTYGAEQPGLPQSEPWFKLIRFDEGKFNSVTRKYRTILLVTTLDNNSKTGRYIRDLLGEKQYSQQLTDSTFLFIETANRWARGQQVLYLIGKDGPSLARAVERKQGELLAFLNNKELQRLKLSIEKKPRNKEAEKLLADSCGLRMAIPKSYKLKRLNSSFAWLLREDDEKTLNLFIALRPYEQLEQFTANSILAYKDSITRVNIAGPTERSYYTTEYLFPPDTLVADFSGNYALQLRGLWRVENDFMGGPFIHTTGLDQKRTRLVSMEGFVYFPKEKKRELLRELEAIIAGIKTM